MTTDNENGITPQLFNKLYVDRIATDEGIEKAREAAQAFLEERIKEKKLPCRAEAVVIDKRADQFTLKFTLRGPSKKVTHTKTWTEQELLASEKPVTLLIEAELDIANAELAKL